MEGQHGSRSVRSKNKNSRPVRAGSSQALRKVCIKRLTRGPRKQTNGCSLFCGIPRCRPPRRTTCGLFQCRHSLQGGAAFHAGEQGCCLRCSVDHQKFSRPTVWTGTHVRSSNSLQLFCVPWLMGLRTKRSCLFFCLFGCRLLRCRFLCRRLFRCGLFGRRLLGGVRCIGLGRSLLLWSRLLGRRLFDVRDLDLGQ